MSVADFLAKFPYAHFKTHPGNLSTALICDVARELQLAGDVKAIRGYDAITDCFNVHRKRVLVQSEINLNQGASDPIYHCSILRSIDKSSFKMWTPWADGTDEELPFLRSDWDMKLCFGLVLV